MMDMDLSLGGAATLACAALVLIVGRQMIAHIAFLRRYAIPEPVVGGLVAALLIAVLYALGARITFDTSMQPALMLAFFATIGLGADVRLLARGGYAFVLFALCVVGMLFMENSWASACEIMGIDPLIGLIAGSVTMAGGHGTGAAWGQRFADVFGVARSPGNRACHGDFRTRHGRRHRRPGGDALVRRLQARALRSASPARRRCRTTPPKQRDRSPPSGSPSPSC